MNFSNSTATATSIQLETAQSMKCLVSKSFESPASSDSQNDIMTILNGTFELTSNDIRLVANENSTFMPSWAQLRYEIQLEFLYLKNILSFENSKPSCD